MGIDKLRNREISLQFLRATGLIPVKIRPKQKDPFSDWDPRKAKLSDHNATLEYLRNDPNLNIGALFFGKTVDVDIDTTDPSLLAALDYFLPKTLYTFGRASKPRSHRIYTLHEDFNRDQFSGILKFVKNLKIKDTSYSVEIRGGKIENGLYTMLAGSTHPSGEEVEWSGNLDPTVSGSFVKLEQLVTGVRLAQAAALISRHWTQGLRNDMSLALAGMMWRIRSRSMTSLGIDMESEIDDGVFLLTEDRAKSLMKAVMTIAGDDENDVRSRLLNLTNTWKKLDADPASKVTGGAVLGEMMADEGEILIKSLYRLLSDSEGIEQLEKLCEDFCMWYGQGVIIDLNMVATGADVPWMSKEQATNSLAGRKIKVGDKKIPLSNIMFNTSILQRVMGMTFDPSTNDRFVQTPQGTKINQWRGFETEPCPQRVSDSEVEPFLQYVTEIVANNDEGLANWVLDWCADLLQKPAEKSGTALVLVGVQGAGKTFLGQHVLGKIIGKAHYVQINKIESLTDKFNMMTSDNKIFVQCDEAMHSYQKNVAAQMKSIITDETLTVEPKGVNAYKKPNHMHLLFTSNEENTAIFIDPTPHERRFTVSKVSSARAKDIVYWEEMHAWIKLGLPKVMRWLLDRPYDKKNILRPYLTDAKRDIQRVGVDPEVSWLINRVASGFILSEKSHQHWWQAYDSKMVTDNDKKRDSLRRDYWPDTVHLPTIEEDFKNYVRAHGKTVYSGSVFTNIKRVVPKDSIVQSGQISVEYNDPRHGQLIKNRIRVYTFPSQDEILDHLKFIYGDVVDGLLEESIHAITEESVTEEDAEY